MWAKAIEISFNKKPENCPDCGTRMVPDTIYSFSADKEIKKLVKTHRIVRGVERFFGILPAFDISSSMSVIFQAVCDSRNESFASIVLIFYFFLDIFSGIGIKYSSLCRLIYGFAKFFQRKI